MSTITAATAAPSQPGDYIPDHLLFSEAEQNEVETYTDVPNAPLRVEFERLRDTTGLTQGDLARAVGVADATSVSRHLGLRKTSEGRLRTHVKYDLAVLYAKALGMSYQDAGV